MAPKKRTRSDASDNQEDWTADIAAPSTPLATDHRAPATPWSTTTNILAETRSQRRRRGMTYFGSPAGGPTAEGSGYGYKHHVPINGSPDFANLQEGTRAQEPSSTHTSASQQYAKVANNQDNNNALPRPDAEDPFGASSYGNENTHLQAAPLPTPTWSGSSYASSNAVGGSGAPTRPPRAAALAALTNIPGNPGHHPAAVPRVFASNYQMDKKSAPVRDDPFASQPTPSSRSGDLRQRDLHPSVQQTGYGATNAPMGNGNDRRPSAERRLSPFDDSQYNWRVSPTPDWGAFLAATSTNRSTQDATASQEGHAAHEGADRSHVDGLEAQAGHAIHEPAQRTQAAYPGTISHAQEMQMQS
ncbi:hypothetical protein BST61_g6026 [Cercospora zeina]